jgi:dolichyl-phosphate-mannose--protein O-mannosyl transferase
MSPASVSALVPVFGFLAMRLFGFTFGASNAVGVLLGIEPMLIVEGRLILIDGFLHGFPGLGILGVALICANPNSCAALLFAGFAAGCVYSAKYTGAGVVVFVAWLVVMVHFHGSVWHFFGSDAEAGILKGLIGMPVFVAAVKCLVIGAVSVYV